MSDLQVPERGHGRKKKKKRVKIWMAVEPNERSLPIAWAEDPKELAEMIGVKAGTIISESSRWRDGMPNGRYQRYVKVEVDDD